MSLVQTIRSASHMRDEFERAGRRHQFSYAAHDALYDYLWVLGEDTGHPVQFDVIALCCEFCEYADPHELAEAYSLDIGADADEEEIREEVESEMMGRGTLIPVEGGGYLFGE